MRRLLKEKMVGLLMLLKKIRLLQWVLLIHLVEMQLT
jgi:hypothetical protein